MATRGKATKRTGRKAPARSPQSESAASSSSPLRPLTPKEAQFVEEYLVDLNAAGAARRCGYSEHTAKQIAHELMTRPHIEAAIAERAHQRAEKTGLTAEKVLSEIMRVALVDIGQAYDADGKLLAIKDMPEDVRRAIASIESEELWEERFEGNRKKRTQIGVTHKVRFWDKLKANELLGKNLKLFLDRIELSGDNSFADLLREARLRVARNR